MASLLLMDEAEHPTHLCETTNRGRGLRRREPSRVSADALTGRTGTKQSLCLLPCLGLLGGSTEVGQEVTSFKPQPSFAKQNSQRIFQ